MAKYMVTLHHVLDGEQDFHPVDIANALRFPEWKKTPWTKNQVSIYQKGESDYLASKPVPVEPGKPPKSKQAAAAEEAKHTQACAALKAAIAKAEPKRNDDGEEIEVEVDTKTDGKSDAKTS